MKNFLKSMALFACTMLLFSACTEETTEDVAVVVVSAPTDVSVTPGDGKIYIEWSIPSVSDADRSRVTWYDADGAQVGRTSYVQVAAGGDYSYITTKYYVGTEPQVLDAGAYTVTIENYISTTLEYSEAVTVDGVMVYNADSYVEKLPTVVECTYEAASTTTYDATLTWSSFDGDCNAVIVYYGDDESITVTDLTSGATTVLEGVSAGTTYYYTASFCPAGSSDDVYVSSEAAAFSTKPEAPTAVSVVSGTERFEVDFTLDVDDFENVDYVLVAYGSEEYQITEGFVSGANKIIIPSVAAGSYEVSVYAVSADGILSDVATAEGEVTVYDADSFSYPVITEVENVEGTIKVYASTAADLISWSVMYTKADGTADTAVMTLYGDDTDSYYMATFSGAEIASSIYIVSATYCPDGVISPDDALVLDDEDSGWVIPVSVQYAPTITAIKTYKTGEVVVEWGMESATDIASSVVTLTYGTSTTITKTVDTNVATTGNTCTFTLEDGLVVGYSYSATVKTVSTQDNDSATSEAWSGIFVYDDSIYANYVPALSNTVLVKNGDNIDAQVTWEAYLNASLTALKATYNGVSASATISETGEITAGATLTNVAFEGSYSYTSTFQPAGEYAQDAVEIEVSGLTLPGIATPAVTTMTLGYDSTKDAATQSSITANWEVETNAGITSYNVYVVKTSEAADFDVATATASATTAESTATIAGLAAETNYTIFVQSTDGGNNQAISAAATITTYGASSYAVESATGLTAVMANNEGNVTLSWTAEGVADLYSVTYSYESTTVGLFDVTIVVLASELADEKTFTPVDGATKITYTVQFCPENGDGVVTVSDDSFTVKLMDPAPAEPTITATTFGYNTTDGSYGTITWDAVAETESTAAAVSYAVYYSDGTTDSVPEVLTDLTYKFTALTAGESYTLYVAAINSEGTYSDYSAATAFTAYAPSSYTAPTLAAAAATGEVTLAWSDYSADALLSVTYTYDETTATILKADMGTSTTLTYVEGVNEVSFTASFQPTGGADAVTVTGTTATFSEPAPTAPTTVAVDSFGYNDENGSYATISWTAPASSNPAVATYAIYAVTSSDSNTKLFETTTEELTYAFTGLTAGESYTFYVASQSAAGTASTYAASSAITAYDATGYTLPTFSTSFVDPTVTITWGTFSEGTLAYSYNGGDYTAATSGGTSTFAYVEGVTTFDYKMTFTAPQTGGDAIVLSGAGVIRISDYDIVVNADGDYEIYTAAGLAAFADMVNGTQVYYNTDAVAINNPNSITLPTAGTASLSINGTLMSAIDLSEVCSATLGTSWTPIANYSAATTNQYKGTFDGNGKTIYNLYINTVGLQAQGLFGYISAATIKDLTLANINVTLNGTSAEGTKVRLHSGGLVGFSTGSTISGCEVSSGSLTVTTGTAADAGGLVGRMSGNTVIENCINRANITSDLQMCGGIVGNLYNSFGGTAGSGGTITACTNYGRVDGLTFAGGIIGYFFATNAASTITDCNNYGEITGTTNIAGIAGSFRAGTATTGLAVMSNCHNYAAVTSTSTATISYVGGITGQASTNGGNVTIYDCSNSSAITSAGGSVAGIVGSEVTGTGVVTIYTSSNSGDIKGTTNVAGIIGQIIGTSAVIGGEENGGEYYYNTGTITATASSGVAGGIVGTSKGTVSYYNNKGEVTVNGVNKNGTDVNGIYGTNSGTVENCNDYYGVAFQPAEAVTLAASLNDAEDAIVVSLSYAAGIENVKGVTLYYRVSGGTYAPITLTTDATSVTLDAATYGVATGSTYEIYAETTNENVDVTASVDGDGTAVTAAAPISITVPAASSVTAEESDIYYYSSRNEYEIRSVAGLNAFADIVNGTSVTKPADMTTNVTAEAWSQDVTADATIINAIELSGSWTPMGTSTAPYTGTFDGGSKTISSLTITATTAGQGLFGYVGAGAEINNVTLTGVNISGTSTIGAIAGCATDATISGCTVSGAVSASGRLMGGIVGKCAGSSVINCTNNATVTTDVVSSGTTISTSYGIGGVVGVVVEGGETSSTLTKVISGCTNSSTAVVTAVDNGVGGVVGTIYVGTLNYKYQVSNCENAAALSVNAHSAGVIGYTRNSATGATSDYIEISNCTNSGKVTGDNNNIGGIVGYAVHCDIYDSSNSGEIYTSKTYAGGIAGHTGTVTYLNGGVSVSSSSNTGNVTAGTSYAGALIGRIDSSLTISNYTNSGAVTIAGSVENGDQSTDCLVSYKNGTSTATFSNCYDTYGAVINYAEAVSGVAAVSTSTGFTVSWEYSAGSSYISSVLVYYRVAGSDADYTTATATSAVTSLSIATTTGVSYEYYVETANANGYITDSDVTKNSTATIAVELAAQDMDIYLESDVYQIYTAEGLEAFEQLVNGTAATTTPAVATNVTSWTKNTSASAKLMANIDLSSVCSATAGDWSPIGGDGYNYTGTFDGGGNTISGLYIGGATTAYQGLFGYTNAATIKNLKINNPYLVSEAGSLGAFIGRMNGVGYLTDCYITGTSGVITGLSYIGGLVGLFSNGYITSCHNEGATVTATMTTATEGYSGVNLYARAGGIVGCATSATAIVGCSNAGDVRFSSHCAAGIAGYVTAAISIVACSNTGDVIAADDAVAGSYAGGIVGYETASASIIGCYNSGAVGVVVVSAMSGGIIGRFSEKVLLKGNYNIGSVSTTSTASKYNQVIGYIAGATSSSTRATDADGNDVYGTYNQYNYFIDIDGDTAVNGDGATTGGNYTPVYSESTIWEVSSISDLDDYIDNMNISLAEVSSDYRYKSSGSTTAGPVLYNTAE